MTAAAVSIAGGVGGSQMGLMQVIGGEAMSGRQVMEIVLVDVVIVVVLLLLVVVEVDLLLVLLCRRPGRHYKATIGEWEASGRC